MTATESHITAVRSIDPTTPDTFTSGTTIDRDVMTAGGTGVGTGATGSVRQVEGHTTAIAPDFPGRFTLNSQPTEVHRDFHDSREEPDIENDPAGDNRPSDERGTYVILQGYELLKLLPSRVRRTLFFSRTNSIVRRP